MSPSVFLRRRQGARGVRWQVRYRLGGREAMERYDSVWPTKTLAEARRNVILDAWVRGVPVPPATPTEPPPAPTLAAVLDDYTHARIDVGAARRKTYAQTRALLGQLAAMDPQAVTPRDVRAWIASLRADGKARKTIEMHLGVLRQVLDHAETQPNPARHPSVKLPARPKGTKDAPKAPTTTQWRALQDAILPRHLLAVQVIEDTGLRISELIALTWGSVDLVADRLLVGDGKTTAATRWVPLTPTTRRRITLACPHEDRAPDRAVVPGVVEQTLRGAIGRACRDAGIPHFSPHNLRHRFISMLVQAGTPIPIVREVVGHERGSVTLDVYAHVLVDERPERLADLRWHATRVVAGTGAAHVRPDHHGRDVDPVETPANADIPGGVEDSGLESWEPDCERDLP